MDSHISIKNGDLFLSPQIILHLMSENLRDYHNNQNEYTFNIVAKFEMAVLEKNVKTLS